ncbi:MAG: histidine kinase, partial [Planctomycetota bacterium]
ARRIIAISLVVVTLLMAQWWFRPEPAGLVTALAVTIAFLLLSPAAWRVLFPSGEFTRFDRLALYGLIACLPAVTAILLRDLAGFGDTLLTDGVNLLVIAALSAVGGWGLARDIHLESGLEQERARSSELQRQAERAELLALRSHLDPHFLFNTLGALAEWTREDPVTAERGLLRLADLMRDVMTGVRDPEWPLERELDAAIAVWELHALRDEERFVHRIDRPQNLPLVHVPPLVLLPLVENAVKHGPGRGHEGLLELRVRPLANKIVVEVENPGAYSGPRAGGQGLDLARRRLAQAHGESAQVQVTSEGDRTRVTVELPAQSHEEDEA